MISLPSHALLVRPDLDIDTDRHLFFDCTQAFSLWRIITHDWGILNGPVTWTMITTLHKPVW
ncbi:hypothetical protein PHMEG_0005867 [Phytophthora megakarya]|uniref:Uncharacterized protein n=1 Tax=Phytophthora megakarya TaxID=4795 RepID=A0A225WQH3_9STRA|nr:hypothetical protein PHMEG_0005867 [Phytophthora megakarya]